MRPGSEKQATRNVPKQNIIETAVTGRCHELSGMYCSPIHRQVR